LWVLNDISAAQDDSKHEVLPVLGWVIDYMDPDGGAEPDTDVLAMYYPVTPMGRLLWMPEDGLFSSADEARAVARH
jgi:hypothetical protein